MSNLIMFLACPIYPPQNLAAASEWWDIVIPEIIPIPKRYFVLNTMNMLRSKLAQFSENEDPNHNTRDYGDVVFLVDKYRNQLPACIPRLNRDHLARFAVELVSQTRETLDRGPPEDELKHWIKWIIVTMGFSFLV